MINDTSSIGHSLPSLATAESDCLSLDANNDDDDDDEPNLQARVDVACGIVRRTKKKVHPTWR